MTISSYLQGGLGNQMFQYAIARALSLHYNADFTLDCSWFNKLEKGVTPRKLELPLLNIDPALFKNSGKLTTKKKFRFLIQQYLPFGPIIQRQVNAYDFDKEIFNLKNINRRDLYLFGYWQSYRYFSHIRSLLQLEFTARELLPQAYKQYESKILTSESVMVHVRRGDYVNSPSASHFHGALDLDYYQTALKDILSIHPNAHFFIFSDDLDWAKLALPQDLSMTYIENLSPDNSTIHELELMTSCKHHIIANSSFSWWGAWLRKNNVGKIYSPNRWISDRSLDLSNLIPGDWNKLKA
ncbi:alpha-1,2-fucosyltransferase [Polynucleobacter sp. 15G-AUS-farblos]|uniref:alpha-1,2-fucosyltransferase n=1 Tax=Polynucleobacter sp. 15G-AUS-farblos TaxID=2689094 RepID=UPI001C0B196E|nr:alpha-1,2-fucosyltransferase [Polynucleobacter sp. 15G-AUS-farblos]MBU3583787.1 alpha-1,2-fucosyltransferase [Polynucleobacter sp. 15G-AUS-farblos]